MSKFKTNDGKQYRVNVSQEDFTIALKTLDEDRRQKTDMRAGMSDIVGHDQAR